LIKFFISFFTCYNTIIYSAHIITVYIYAIPLVFVSPQDTLYSPGFEKKKRFFFSLRLSASPLGTVDSSVPDPGHQSQNPHHHPAQSSLTNPSSHNYQSQASKCLKNILFWPNFLIVVQCNLVFWPYVFPMYTLVELITLPTIVSMHSCEGLPNHASCQTCLFRATAA
jgi:hypothetical protein